MIDPLVKKNLKKVRALIVRGWTRGAYARDIHGIPVKETHRSAVRWCTVGAIRKVTPDDIDLRIKMCDAIRPHYLGITEWNDAQKDKRVILRAIDRVIYE